MEREFGHMERVIDVVLLGSFPQLEAYKGPLSVIRLDWSDQLLAALSEGLRARLYVMRFFVPKTATFELFPTIRSSNPSALVGIATAQALNGDPKWSGLCDRFVDYDISIGEIEDALGDCAGDGE